MDNDLFSSTFQRAESEVILSNNPEAVKSRHSRVVPLIASANPVGASPKVTPFKDLVVESCIAHVSNNPSTEKIPLSIMAASPFVPCIPTLVLTWADKYLNSHAHVLLAMPLGTKPGDLLNPTITKMDGVSVLHVKWKWPATMLDPTRMFGHSRFNGQLGTSHPKFIALVKTTDNIWGSHESCTSNMTIKIPPREDYPFTPTSISGHKSMTLPVLPPLAPNGSISPHATIFLLFDLMVKNSYDGKKFSTKAKFEDDTKLD